MPRYKQPPEVGGVCIFSKKQGERIEINSLPPVLGSFIIEGLHLLHKGLFRLNPLQNQRTVRL